jgi:membrane-associated protein
MIGDLLRILHEQGLQGVIQQLIVVGGLYSLIAIVFAETGLLFGFFLPGDSLLVTAGVFCTSANPFNHPLLPLWQVLVFVSMAAVAGDTVGYWIGKSAGPKLFTREQSLFFSRKHLLRTKEFYERHGGKTIVMARFVPFARTFAPVVAGIGQMDYRRFASYNVFGGIGWVVSMTMLGWGLASVYPDITKQIDKLALVIIVLSLLPGLIGWLRNKQRARKNAPVAS